MPGRTWPLMVSMPSVGALSATPDWAMSSSVRELNRSARTPPNSPSNSRGAFCRAWARPTMTRLSVSFSSSQSWAMRATQKPVPPNSMATT